MTVLPGGRVMRAIHVLTETRQLRVVAASKFTILQAFSATAEQLPEFLAAPHGDGIYRDSSFSPGL
jgi:hypothetical protein